VVKKEIDVGVATLFMQVSQCPDKNNAQKNKTTKKEARLHVI